jgi:hypothetical protein
MSDKNTIINVNKLYNEGKKEFINIWKHLYK